jgi:hypothetical protein
MNSLQVLTVKHSKKQLVSFKQNGFLEDMRGGKHSASLYDYFPELETEAKLFVEENISKKQCTFNVSLLAQHLNNKCHDLSGSIENGQSILRSNRMLLYDLKNWGYSFKKNTKRIYFEGHEREDVVLDRQAYVNHFLEKENHYYRVDENDNFIKPSEHPHVLIFHDESTFRSAEQSEKRWMKEGFEPFFSKG